MRRFALTPRQKSLKRDYALQQQRDSDPGIPDWSEIVDSIGDGGDQDEWIIEEAEADNEAYARVLLAEELLTAARIDPDVIESVAHRGVPVESFDSISDADTATITALLEEEYVPDLYEEPYLALFQDLQDGVVAAHYKKRYDALVTGLGGTLQGSNVFRLIRLPAHVDPRQHDGLGIYWTQDSDLSGLYYHDDKRTDPTRDWLFEARVDLRSVNMNATVRAQMDTETGEAEAEIQFYSGAPIWVYDATEILEYDRESGPRLEWSGVPDQNLAIDGWRRA